MNNINKLALAGIILAGFAAPLAHAEETAKPDAMMMKPSDDKMMMACDDTMMKDEDGKMMMKDKDGMMQPCMDKMMMKDKDGKMMEKPMKTQK
jgi:hypothetical protein